MTATEKTKQNSGRRKAGHIILIIILVLLLSGGVYAYSVYTELNGIKREAQMAKDCGEELFHAIKSMDPGAVRTETAQLKEHMDTLERQLESKNIPFLSELAGKKEDVMADIQTANEGMDLVRYALDEIVLPLADQLEAHPVSGIRNGRDADADALQSYLDFYGKIRPDILRVTETAATLHFRSLDTGAYEEILRNDCRQAEDLIQILDEAEGSVFRPMIHMLRAYPLSKLKQTEKGLNVGVLLAYLDFLDEVEPGVRKITDRLREVSFQSVDLNIRKYLKKILWLFDDLEGLEDYRELIRMFLGDGEDRLYLVMAQNMAEIRASGGFPGSMGVVRIKDGVLTMGDFSSVLNFLKMGNTEASGITDTERQLFQNMYARLSHDACYNPDFSRVAQITKTAYEIRNEETVDGVIALTPEIIQKVLALTGKSIKLDDGTRLTGENATKILQRDLYYRYQGDNATAINNNDYIDGLFAQTAKKAMRLLFKSISMDNITEYLEFLGSLGDNRTMLLWFADEKAESIAEKNHCAGTLNHTPWRPEAGVYFSCCDPGKLGMFTAMDITANKAGVNEDGAQVYKMRVTFSNYVGMEDVSDINSWYIMGSRNRAIQGYAYFFAPAGGTVTDFKASNGMWVNTTEYKDLQVGYLLNLYLYPGKPVSVTYTLTVAPGAREPLGIDSTPTLQAYR